MMSGSRRWNSSAPTHSRPTSWGAYLSAESPIVSGIEDDCVTTRPARPGSDPVQLIDRALVADIPRVQRRGGLEEQHVGLLVGDRPVLDAVRHDEELAG